MIYQELLLRNGLYIYGDQKNSFKRIGTDAKLVNSEDLKAILRDAYGDDSAETLDGFDFTDLNLVDIQNYKAFYAEQNEEPEVIEEDNKQFFKRIGLYRKDKKDKKFKITRALLLLFGKYNAIQDKYPDFMLDLVIKHSPLDEDYVDRLYTSFRKNTPERIFMAFYASINKVTGSS